MLYLAIVGNLAVDVPVWMIPLPIPVSKPKRTEGHSIRCLLIEIDSNNLVREYSFKLFPYKSGERSTKCLNRFFSENEIKYGATFFRAHVAIDIMPNSDLNEVIPTSKEFISVAILGSRNFRPREIDRTTVTFGPMQASPAPDDIYEDVDYDGFEDRVFHFKIQETGIDCGDTEATLNGETNLFFNNILITGTSAIDTIGCN